MIGKDQKEKPRSLLQQIKDEVDNALMAFSETQPSHLRRAEMMAAHLSNIRQLLEEAT